MTATLEKQPTCRKTSIKAGGGSIYASIGIFGAQECAKRSLPILLPCALGCAARPDVAGQRRRTDPWRLRQHSTHTFRPPAPTGLLQHLFGSQSESHKQIV